MGDNSINEISLQKNFYRRIINFQRLFYSFGSSYRSSPQLRKVRRGIFSNFNFPYYLYVGRVISHFMKIVISENIRVEDGIDRSAMSWATRF